MKIQEMLAAYPKVDLVQRPTPLDYLPHLSRQLDVNVYIKRDDLTDLALGGDKPRKLEYELARAQAAGADTLVTYGSAQSNHARLTTAAARKLGMDCAVVLSDDEHRACQGNLLTVYLMGADVRFIEVEDHWDLEEHARALCVEIDASGRKTYLVPLSGTTPHSCLGYVAGALETLQQIEDRGIQLEGGYTPFGTGGIFSAMLLTFREKGIPAPFRGISVNRDLATCHANLDKWWNALCELLQIDPQRPRGEFDLDDGFVGRHYGDATEECLAAISRIASTEGILLDPVYSGKMAAGFFSDCENGRWEPGQNVLLLHSGGVPALFAYHRQIESYIA
jgi:1-aminocyclopropane-1-carboxylate deaminase/D-cysteine desulfhydrase-like pyridoxal-dependent ACC family enzyme